MVVKVEINIDSSFLFISQIEQIAQILDTIICGNRVIYGKRIKEVYLSFNKFVA
ncbi:hypothetical protein HNP38_003379 [Chryseobacterium defluvii]|uniref:Uncharacterized protein n=1 Tax=Chryseobacterium defluvii TaxID=160396 RepID=A0A840KEP8_9FLAO|nr:hypothetical protein [Chryseobacterium defluvii]